ncbi:hypothetical protein DL96DRAFT_129302 [Flagelloscypha sp. PMI_526]|nr:hypothetical protein DL96DRAFT_129302 [Flagelloscypha sp. PMI_526]
MKGGFKDPFNVSFAHAEGFNPNEVSAVNFASKNCSARLDYAIVDAEDGVAPGSSSLAGSTTSGATIGATPGTTAFSSPKSKPPIGPIVGGVVGGVVIILMLLVAGVWIMRRRRKPIIPYNNQATPLTKEPETVLTPMPYRLSNTASTGATAREKQALADRLDETQISSQGNGLSGGLVSSQHVPQTSNAEQPSAVGNTNPDVQARVAQLQAEIHEIQSRGALPPPY